MGGSEAGLGIGEQAEGGPGSRLELEILSAHNFVHWASSQQ